MTTRAFLDGVGFRRAGTRLAMPVTVEQDDRTLTVLRLVATVEATDLVYELTHRPDDEGTFPTPQRHAIDVVGLHDGTAEYRQAGGMSISVRAGKLVRSFTMAPLPEDTRHVELRVSGPSIGDWRVPLELQPYPGPGDPRYRVVHASDTHHGVTVSVRGMVEISRQTAFDLMAMHEAEKTRVMGLGGMNMRDESTALTLHDQNGRSYAERFRNDARDQLPDPTGIADVAIFDALPDDATELVLEVPTVCFDDYRAEIDVDLPITAPVDARFGDYPIRLLASREASVTRGPEGAARAVAIDVDLGSIDDPICVIMPGGPKIDGKFAGMGFGGAGINGSRPKPLTTLEIFPGDGPMPSRVTFAVAKVRARGPWMLRFSRPR